VRAHLLGLAGWLYRVALRALPWDLRDEYEPEMVALFTKRIEEASGLRRFTLFFSGCIDAVVQGLAARWSPDPVARHASVPSRFDTLRVEVGSAWRRLRRHPTTSVAAVVSLALAIGACASAFRLVDALLLRPLPIEAPERLFHLSYHVDLPNHPPEWDSGSYPMFRLMRDAVQGQAEVIATSVARLQPITFRSETETERAVLQRMSGGAFRTLGLQPSLGRLLTEFDDITPGAHPQAVISHGYWMRRFGGDPEVLGRTFASRVHRFEIVGVGPQGFTGLEPGVNTEVFVPTMMGPDPENVNQNGLRTFVHLGPDASLQIVTAQLRAAWNRFQEPRIGDVASLSPAWRTRYLQTTRMSLNPAGAGVSAYQAEYGRPLMILSVLVGLVLLIACGNVANLLFAQATSRSREMAVRVSVGASRGRLVRMMMAESTMMAVLASVLGGLFAWWATPVVVGMLSQPENPIQLSMPLDFRVLAFGSVLALAVAVAFGLAPALRASSVHPVQALKGVGRIAARRRLMSVLVSVQASFCFLVLFAAVLFVSTFSRLTNLRTGFSAVGVVALDVRASPALPSAQWDALTAQVAEIPGVDRVALAGWPLLDGSSTNSPVSISGREPEPGRLTEILCVSPGWIDVMQIPLMAGRDLRNDDTRPGAVLVNQAFVRQHFGDRSPLEAPFETVAPDGFRTGFRIVGVVGDVRYLDLRGQIPPAAYVPCQAMGADGELRALGFVSIVARGTAGVESALGETIRREVTRAGSSFRVDRVRTQDEINARHTMRERLLAALSVFFAAVALALAGVGLYGMMHYLVLQRTHEIGVRRALGATTLRVARQVTWSALGLVTVGVLAGVLVGVPVTRRVEGLFYGVDSTHPTVIIATCMAVLAMGALAVLPGLIRALKIEPASALRAE